MLAAYRRVYVILLYLHPVSPILDKFEYLPELYLIFLPVFQFYCTLSRSTLYSGTGFYSVTYLSLNS